MFKKGLRLIIGNMTKEEFRIRNDGKCIKKYVTYYSFWFNRRCLRFSELCELPNFIAGYKINIMPTIVHKILYHGAEIGFLSFWSCGG